MVLMDVAVDRKNGALLKAVPVRASDLRFQLRELLHNIGRRDPLQEVVAIETEWLIRQARGVRSKNWILNTGCILAEHGAKMFAESREKLSAVATSGYLTIRQLAKLSPVTGNQKTLRRWLKGERWTEHGKGKHCRIRVCDEFYWWYVKQLAGDLARELLKKKKVEVDERGFQMDGGKIVGIERRALEALEHRVRLRTKTVGRSLEEIAKDPDKDKVWTLPAEKIPPYWFKSYRQGQSLTTGADALMLANLIQELRQGSFQKGGTGHVSKAALARLLGISKRTFLRKGFGEIYDRIYRKPSAGEAVVGDAEEYDFTETELNEAKSGFEHKKAQNLIPCAKCGKWLRITQPCPKCNKEL